MNDLSWPYRKAAQAPLLISIENDHLPLLSALLQRSQSDDPFARSAAYFAITGRNGLWLYGDNQTFMLIARHPNNNDKLLFFPPIGRSRADLITTALADALLPSGIIEMARVGADDALLAQSLSSRCQNIRREDTLDWTYPVHVVSANIIIKREGKPFVSFRGHINRAMREGLNTEPVNIWKHEKNLTSIIHAWACNRGDTAFSIEDLTSPTLKAIELMKTTNLDIRGTLSKTADGTPTGFWLWEQNGDMAMSLVRAYLRAPGNAELGILGMAQQLKGAGIPHMCLGGSETADLDSFKRKMQPVRSIALNTIDLPRRVAPDHRLITPKIPDRQMVCQ
ncbi:MAG: phosphatidylglycerol lysyltransferase domain-containing protein [Alphaproteobacteria bacterium]